MASKKNQSQKKTEKKRSSPKKKSKNNPKPKKKRFIRAFFISAVVVAVTTLILYSSYLYVSVLPKFQGKRWAVPATVYSRPLELYVGQTIKPEDLETELRLLRYEKNASLLKEGTYHRDKTSFKIATRGFKFWDAAESAERFHLMIEDNQLISLKQLDSADDIDVIRFDPVRIGSFSSHNREDRLLVKYQQIPELLIKGLIAVEDKGFYSHAGIQPLAILRALLVNLRAGKTVQGGSTITQQLIKNYFLSNRRNLLRKVNEALLALMIETENTKEEILEAYFNEVYLLQDGKRAIHGFGLASQFLFNRPLSELEPEQLALLIGIIKGPSYYDPRRYPERALTRRNLVLDIMAKEGIITPIEASSAQQKPLGISSHARRSDQRYPAFIDLVRRQLNKEYEQEDLVSEGLNIFTTLDPVIQQTIERKLNTRLQRIEASRGLEKDSLQSAVIILRNDNAEVLGLAGDRKAGYAGFNRAIDAVRQVGSLIKPAVYLTALQDREKYHLATKISDEALSIEINGEENWEPRNYDEKNHGDVLLYQALTHSYNIATARLGLDLGLDKVIKTLRQLGVKRSIPDYPSILLGSVSLSPLEVAQMYQTLATDGFRSPLRTIRAVLDHNGRPLKRYPLSSNQSIDQESAFILKTALIQVAEQGTARSIKQWLPHKLASKTGTTNGLRDSWFVGIERDKLGVVWVGRDDNKSASLTGSSGALNVWGDIFSSLNVQDLDLMAPENVQFANVETETGNIVDPACAESTPLAFFSEQVKQGVSSCSSGKFSILKFLKNL